MNKYIRKGFKLREGAALEAVKDIVANTCRNITGAIEYLLLKGYKQFQKEQDIINGCGNRDVVDKKDGCRKDGCGKDGTCKNCKCDGGEK